jgi:hypothetical protein
VLQIDLLDEQVDQLPDAQAGLGQGEVHRQGPGRGRLEEGQLGGGVEDEDRLGVFDLEPLQRQLRERVGGVGRQVPPLGGEGVQGAAGLQDEQHALVAQPPLGRMRVAVGGHLDGAQVGGESFGLDLVGQGRPGLAEGEGLEVVGGRAVAADGGQGGVEDVLVIVEELLA